MVSKPTCGDTLRVSPHVGFFVLIFVTRGRHQRQFMDISKISIAQQIGRAAAVFEEQRTGIAPTAITVVLGEGTLVITLQGALSSAERAMAMTPDGAAKVQELHRQLFNTSAEPLRKEIKRITGVAVCEASAEVDAMTGTVVQVFTSGAMVQVFLMAEKVASETWSGDGKRN